jgi:hypothetical protein
MTRVEVATMIEGEIETAIATEKGKEKWIAEIGTEKGKVKEIATQKGAAVTATTAIVTKDGIKVFLHRSRDK